MYKYDDMKSSHFSVTSDLVSGCFNVDTGRFTLRESEVKAVYRGNLVPIIVAEIHGYLEMNITGKFLDLFTISCGHLPMIDF